MSLKLCNCEAGEEINLAVFYDAVRLGVSIFGFAFKSPLKHFQKLISHLLIDSLLCFL